MPHLTTDLLAKPKYMLSSRPFRTAVTLSLFSVAFLLNAQDKPSSTGSLQDFLLASSAADFAAHEQTRPARVKNVQLRYTEDDRGKGTYMLCGRFQTTNQAASREWSDFATIKTAGYEQLLGAQASGLCKNARSLRTHRDLTAALQSKLVAATPTVE
jgi:hypothetical protein